MTLNEYLELKGRGSLSALSAAIGAHAPDVSRWASGERRVPAEHCPAIELETGGLVRCEEMRPDVLWNVLRKKAAA